MSVSVQRRTQMRRPKPWRQRIDRFIPESTPLGRGDEVSMLLRAAGGSPLGAAVLAAIARKESSFGQQAFVPNNFWGYGIHAGPSVNRAPSVEAMATRVWNALQDPKGYYKGEGRFTLPDILMKYAPPSENDTRLYQQQTAGWMREMGFNPNANVFTGARVPMRGGGPPGMTTAGESMAVTPQTAPAQVSLDWPSLNKIFRANQADIFAGRTPDPRRLNELLRVVQEALPIANDQAVQTVSGKGPARAAQSVTPAKFAGNYGFPTGGVDSARAMAGGAGGNWAGAMPRALALAHAVGGPKRFAWMSQKRARKLTASGNVSDHWVGNSTAYATDLGASGASGDKLFRNVMQYLSRLSGRPSIASTKSGTWHNFNIGGYRYQVGWRVPGHYDHVHVGVKKL